MIKNILIGAAVIFFIPSFCFAAAPFSDDFDSYSVGNLTGQGGWTDTPSFTVVDSGCSGGGGNCARSSSNGYANKLGNSLTTGDWYFDFKFSGTITTQIELRFWNYSGGGLGYIYVYPDGAAGQVKLGSNVVGSINSDTWYTIGVHWSAGSMTANINGGALSSPVALGGDGSINMIWQYNNYSNDYYLDNFTETAPVTDQDTITFTYPTETPSYFDHISLNYHIQQSHAGFKRADVMVCGGDVVSCQTLCTTGYIEAYQANCWRIINTTGCPETDTFDRSLNFSSFMVNVEGATSTIVTAKAYLFAASPAADPPCALTTRMDLESSPDWLASDTLTVQYQRAGIDTAGLEEDCSAYSGIDAVVCNIKNFFIGAFLPSNAAINQFRDTLQQFGQKFPMSYINATLGTIVNIYTGISEDAPIEITIFGNTGNVDTSIFDIAIPNTTLTLGEAIKTFFNLLAIMVFLIWAIGYMHRLPNAA